MVNASLKLIRLWVLGREMPSRLAPLARLRPTGQEWTGITWEMPTPAQWQTLRSLSTFLLDTTED